MRRYTYTIIRLCGVLLVSVLLLLACGGDDDDDAPTATSTEGPSGGTATLAGSTEPAENTAPAGSTATGTSAIDIAEAKIEVDAGCAITRAWGGPDPLNLTELDDCSSPVEERTLIPAGGAVITDVSGQAWLDFVDEETRENCGRLYVFHDGDLQRSPDQPGGLQLKSGTALWRNECSGLVTIETPSADIELRGTTLIASYLAEEQMTVVALLDGWVEATPLIELNVNVTGTGTGVERGQFWFSTPGEDPPSVAGLDARQPHGLEDLPQFIAAMNMESWIASALDVAEAEGIDTGGMVRPEVALLRGAGGVLDQPDAQNALMAAVNDDDWDPQVDALFPDREGALITLIGDESPVNVERLSLEFDPSPDVLAGLSITLLISQTDAASTAWARFFMEALVDTGIQWEVIAVAPDSALERFNALAAGSPTLWLERIPEPTPSPDPEETEGPYETEGPDETEAPKEATEVPEEPDTSPPEIIRLEHIPDEPTTEDQVTVVVEARDPESGVASIEISLFGDPIQSCQGASCEVALGGFEVEGSVEYGVVVTNGEGIAEEFSRQFDVVQAEPDLEAALILDGEPAYQPNTELWQVPVLVELSNSGTGTAGLFTVTVEAVSGDARQRVPFIVPGQDDPYDTSTTAPLAPGTVTTLRGIVELTSIDDTALVATADTCIGEEFVPESCSVLESDETNNASEEVAIPSSGLQQVPEPVTLFTATDNGVLTSIGWTVSLRWAHSGENVDMFMISREDVSDSVSPAPTTTMSLDADDYPDAVIDGVPEGEWQYTIHAVNDFGQSAGVSVTITVERPNDPVEAIDLGRGIKRVIRDLTG